MVLKCGAGISKWQPQWRLSGAGVSMWRWIVKASTLFWTFGYVDPGVGWVAFWDDIWVRGGSVRVIFPRVAAATSSQDCCFFDVFPACFRDEWFLPMRVMLWSGALREYESFVLFMRLLPVETLSEGPSSISWPLATSGSFTVKSLKAFLSREKFLGVHEFPFDMIWSKVVPTKIQCFMWLSYHGRISTIDMLQSRGFQFPNRCSLCSLHEESVSHIFLHCPFVVPIWSRIRSRLSIYGPFPATIADLIEGWKGLNCDESFKAIKGVWLHSFLWHVWLERNDVIFRDAVASTTRVFCRSWVASCMWLKVHAVISQHDFELWMRQLTAT
ncbi:Putative ribonuclease H protein At1g65750 [Linum perenne]